MSRLHQHETQNRFFTSGWWSFPPSPRQNPGFYYIQRTLHKQSTPAIDDNTEYASRKTDL